MRQIDFEDRFFIRQTENQFLNIIKKLPKSLPAGFQSTVKKLAQFQTAVSMSQDATVVIQIPRNHINYSQVGLCHQVSLREPLLPGPNTSFHYEAVKWRDFVFTSI